MIAQRLAAHPRFRWAPGMAALVPSVTGDPVRYRLYRGSGDLLCGQGEPSGFVAGWEVWAPICGGVPDLSDPATAGCLLAMLRACPSIGRLTVRIEPGAVVVQIKRGRRLDNYSGPTLGEAVAVALLHVWESSP